MMLGGLGILILSSLLMGFWKNIIALCVGRFAQGLSSGAIWVLGLALIADTHSPKEMGLKMGFIFSAYSAGNFIGPIVGGPLYQYLGYIAPFVVIAILGLVDGVARMLLMEPKRMNQNKTSVSILGSLRYMFQSIPLVLILTLTASAGVLIGSLEVCITLFLEKRYGFTPEQVGYAFLAIAIPELVFGPIAGYLFDRFGFRRVTIPGLIFTSVFMALMAIRLPLAGFLTVLGVLAAFLMFGLTPLLPEIVHCVPETMYGASYGLFNCAFAVGLFIGPIVGAVLFQYTGWEGYVYTFAGFMLLNVIIPILFNREDGVSNQPEPVIVLHTAHSQDTVS
jgi:MFS family permease